MKKEGKILNSYIDFLKDDAFIEWNLLPTDELNRYWTDYIESHPEKGNEFNMAIEKFKAIQLNRYTLPEEVKKQLYRKIIKMAGEKKAEKRRITYYWAAAAVGLLLFASWLFFPQKKEKAEIPHVAEVTDAIVIQPLPSSEIQLISADKVIELGQNTEIAISADGQATLNEEQIADTKNVTLSTEVMNRLIVPSGKRSILLLPDGSKIWVNSGSELEFPAGFTGATRDIYVKGEIYIEVAQINDQPFRVHTSRFEVTVRGTKFNVSAYSDAGNQSVVLVGGKVEVNLPNQKAHALAPGELFDLTDHQVHISKVNTDEYVSWKDGILIFNTTSVADILKKISRYYNVTFEDRSNNRLSEKTCTGKLVLADNLDDVITALSVLSSTVFYRENEIIYIKNQ